MRRPSSGLAIAVLLGGLAPAGGAASQAPPAAPATEESPTPEPGPEVVFGSAVDYIEVDAVVTGEDGEIVRGLTREDFVVLEAGQPREIATFAEIALPFGDPAGIRPGRGRRRNADVTTNAVPLSGRIYAIILDDLHTHARRSNLVREIR
jgi:hypothetical protein